jgi:hypothetical protein
MNDPLNDTHTTDGEHYRIPAHPRMIAALGRAMWNFLSLEETAVAILAEVGTHNLTRARALKAGRKEKALKLALTDLRRRNAPPAVLKTLERGIDAFALARAEHRNALAHAGLFTVGYDEDDIYLPGVALKGDTGTERMIRDASELHGEAHAIEDSHALLGEARAAINVFLNPT